MKKLLIAAFLLGRAFGQITAAGSGSQAITLSSPTPITCGPAATEVTCTAPPPTITLPIEVFGPAGTTSSVTFELPSAPTGAVLWLQVHGLRYQTEASVQVNNSVWLPLATPGVTVQGLGAAYGGIGGGFATLSMTVPLPAGVLVAGVNTVSFRFNGTDGVSSGYRVLALNLQVSGVNVLPASNFITTNLATWTAPLNDAADIAAGLSLWQSAALADPASGAMIPIKAHCADCHAEDGRDLKYFNYSNLSIETRATFHGLTALQGQQIASYIRSLTTPAPGLPWNPPYQPGPGLDSQPVSNWAAGAGLAAVLSNDAALQPYLSNMAATAYLNPRETPLPLQFPDWNSWLPRIHPMDAFTTFTASPLFATYGTLRTVLAPATPAAYRTASGYFTNWHNQYETFLGATAVPTANWAAVQSVLQWKMVKHWEMNQDFGLEAMASAIFPKPNLRAWIDNEAFLSEPGAEKIPVTAPQFANGTQAAWEYFENDWNSVQLVLNDGQGTQSASSPLDYSYVRADVKDLSLDTGNTTQAMLELYVMTKALQENTLIGVGPQGGYLGGFQPESTDPLPLGNGGFQSNWTGYPALLQATLTTQYVQAWINQISTYTPAQMYAGKDGNGRPWATATEDCSNISTDPINTFGGEMWYALPRLRFVGVPAPVMAQVYAWFAKVYPATNWAASKAIVCSSLNSCPGAQQ